VEAVRRAWCCRKKHANGNGLKFGHDAIELWSRA
jgi:hypothetical protein